MLYCIITKHWIIFYQLVFYCVAQGFYFSFFTDRSKALIIDELSFWVNIAKMIHE